MSWLMRIKRGATVRVPLYVLDAQGAPVPINEATATLTPDGEGAIPISLTQGNGKLQMPAFVWRGQWATGANYIVGDVVVFGDEYFRATEANTATQPRGSSKWETFGQLVVLLSPTETVNYGWEAGGYAFNVVFGNGDIEPDFLTGRVKVTG